MNKTIYKICPNTEWQQAVAEGAYRGSPDDLRDGFIHFSTDAQLPGTLAKHFAGQPDLLLISFRASALGDKLKWEASRDGALFPHLYGDLDPTLAIKTHQVQLDQGEHIIPENIKNP